ncbi:MAG TPA: glucose-6-phosphate isomerase [Salinivirgaceae bacterium]|nr:glucose-6-phosphate isomerase [Salinivirgaceae bacterium]
MLKIKLNNALPHGVESIKIEINQALDALAMLQSGNGKGNDFLGWLTLPSSVSSENIEDIIQTAQHLRSESDVVVIVGIGGSYLGARAVIEALTPAFSKSKTEIVYAGHHLDADYYYQLLQYLKDKRWSIVVISKSGTTTEPAVAFRLLRKAHIEAFGIEKANRLTVAITDQSKGALRKMADQNKFKTYVIPDNVGGRYSVLTPVGLLPIAIAGIDIRQLIHGAQDAEQQLNRPVADNAAVLYAASRNKLYQQGKKIEMMVTYHPQLFYFIEWWKQLYGESEGKENKGIFVSGAIFTTDLHSLGQYIQQGERHLFETLIYVENSNHSVAVVNDEQNIDGLNYLSGKDIHMINKTASQATLLAHTKGGVPNIVISIDRLDAKTIGYLVYFYEIACGISGYMLGVNPFDQPGVEDYKVNMFALLGKPGYEEQKERLQKLL